MKLYNITGREKGGWSSRSIINVLAENQPQALELAKIDVLFPFTIKEMESIPQVITITRL